MAEGSSSALAPVGVEAVEGAGGGGGELQGLQGSVREYRKGNWTLHETVVLIAAKKKDEERRLKGGEKEKSRTAELRWKWIENYCWHNGCLRNQNQCNDKWDNLLRDYKKVRDYEMRLAAALPSSATSASASSSSTPHQPPPPPPLSYWQLEKHERKEKGLPSNLLFQVYEALHEVVDKRYPVRGTAVPAIAGNNHQLAPPPPPPLLKPPPQLAQQQEAFHVATQLQPPQLLAQQQHAAGPSASVLSGMPFAATLPNLPQQTAAHSSAPMHEHHPSPVEYASESSESEGSEVPASPAKRRKVDSKVAVERTTTELTQALLACEERKDRRHRDLLSVEEKKLMLENTKTQISRDGIAGLIAAINNLAAAVVSLASDKSLGQGE